MGDVIKVLKSTVPSNKLAKGEGSSLNGDAWLHPEVLEEEEYDRKVRNITQSIAKKELPNVNNFYSKSMDRQTNLERYLSALFWIKPTYMFIGEAPGIHGCARTGIPFTSERVIREGTIYRHFSGPRFIVEGNTYEGSAAYFWEMINRMPKPPILWNVFPLHPDKMVNGEMKNRTPKAAEKEWGRQILQQVVALFQGIRIITVGNHAKEACERLGIETFGHIIHPAYHVNEFR